MRTTGHCMYKDDIPSLVNRGSRPVSFDFPPTSLLSTLTVVILYFPNPVMIALHLVAVLFALYSLVSAYPLPVQPNLAPVYSPPCPDGQYFAYNVCITCPNGYQCSFSKLEPCPAGTSSPPGSRSCTPCPVGHLCPGQPELLLLPDIVLQDKLKGS